MIDKRWSTVSLALYLGAIFSASAQTAFTQGVATVSATGAFQYSIPIKLAAARNNTLPQLALEYNSRAGNGLMGMGWALNGLSMITRCPRTMAQDGVVADIQFLATDAYCLNGKRLIPVKGVNGADGTEYRLENDEFLKITSRLSYNVTSNTGAVVSGGPWFFKVQTKSGITLSYGSNETSTGHVLTMGNSTPTKANPIRGWALESMRDQFNNGILFYYSNVSAANQVRSVPLDDGVFYLTNLTYNLSNSYNVANGGFVRFTYGSRNETPVRYQAGYALPHADKSLQFIESFGTDDAGDSFLFSKYETFTLESQEDGGLPGSHYPNRISEIAECVTWCKSPLKLTWEDRRPEAFSFANSLVGFPGTRNDYDDFFVDLNGTGKKSWVKVSRGSDEAWIGTAGADGVFSSDRWTRVPQSVGLGNQVAFYFADINGDGKADWISVNRTTPDAWYALGSGDGNFQPWVKVSFTVGPANTTKHYFADVNGDGRADWIQNGPIGVNQSWATTVSLPKGNGDFQFLDTGIFGQFGQGQLTQYWIADVNGDGLSDIVSMTPPSYGAFLCWISKGDGTFVATGGSRRFQNAAIDVNTKYYVADINGDGNADIIAINPGGDVWRAYGKGDGNFDAPTYINDTPASNLKQFADLDGDGMIDWVSVPNGAPSGSALTIFPSNGADGDYNHANGGVPFTLTLPGISSSGTNQFYLADVNGDGKSDLIITSSNGQAWAAVSQAVFSGKLIAYGPKGFPQTHVAYKSIADSQVYTSDSDAVYPLRDAVFPMRYQQKMPMLVSSIISPNGIGGTVATNYTYQGAKTDVRDRGFLGIRIRNATQVESGITTTDEYRLEFPYTGLVKSTKTTSSSGGNAGLLSQADFTYSCNDFVPGNCALAPGKRYFPYITSVKVAKWDLNGTAFPTTTSSYMYDEFGNVTQRINSGSDGYIERTDTIYSNDTTKWLLGLPTKTTVTKTSP
jgi:hypothetical protein